MTRIALVIVVLTLAACGPSQEDVNNTATITCNIMGESRNMDAAMRIKEINAAREKIGAEPFLDSDDVIKESFEWGLCEELVKNDPGYSSKVFKLRAAAQKVAEERRASEAEARRKQEAEEAEARRIREEVRLKREAEEAEARLKREEEEAEAQRIRIAKEAADELEERKQYRQMLQDRLEMIEGEPSLTSITFNSIQESLSVVLRCNPSHNGLEYDLVLSFKGNNQMRFSGAFLGCGDSATLVKRDIRDDFFYDSPSLLDDLISATMQFRRLDSFYLPGNLSAREKRALEPPIHLRGLQGLPIEERPSIQLRNTKVVKEEERVRLEKKAAILREKAKQEAENLLKGFDSGCPETSSELSEGIRLALELGNTELYRALISCPKPRR